MKIIFIMFFLVSVANAQLENDFKRFWSFLYQSTVSHSIKEYSFFNNFSPNADTVFIEYLMSDNENIQIKFKSIVQHLFHPHRLNDFFTEMNEIKLLVVDIKQLTNKIDKYGNHVISEKKHLAQFRIDRENSLKINWVYVKDNFYLINTADQLSSLIFKYTFELNEMKYNDFQKFIVGLGFIEGFPK